MKVFLTLAAVALLATVAMPAAGAHPDCLPTDPTCEPIEQRDCPAGTWGGYYVYGHEVIACIH